LASARAVSSAWLAQIDAGLYSDSYDAECEAMQQQVDKNKWTLVLETLRSPWGSLVSRQETNYSYKPDGVEGLPGPCMLITYNTSFKNFNTVLEIVALQWDGGKWRPAGYNAMKKPVATDNTSPMDQPTTPLPQ
jgi:hypothetical protein